MRKLRLLLFLLFLPLVAQAAPNVTVTATSTTLLGTSQTITLTCSLIDPNQTGVLRTGGTVITNFSTSTATPGTTATCGPVWGNDVILDGFGNTLTSYYLIGVYTVSGGIVASTPSLLQAYQFTGSGTFDLSTVLPYALGPVTPAGTVFGQNLTFNGNNIFNGTTALNGGGSTAGAFTHSGLHTFNAGLTSAGPNTLNGGGTTAGTWTHSGANTFGSTTKVGTFLLTDVGGCPSGTGGFTLLCADANDNELKFNYNGSSLAALPSLSQITTNYTNATTTFSPLAIGSYDPFAGNSYTIDCRMYVQGSAVTAAPKFEFTATSAFTYLIISLSGAPSATTYGNVTTNAASSAVTLGNLGAINTTYEQDIHVAFIASSTGAINLNAAANGAGTLTILAGSSCSFQ